MKKQKSFLLDENRLCTLVKVDDLKKGWIGSVSSEKLAPYIGKWLRVRIIVEEVKNE